MGLLDSLVGQIAGGGSDAGGGNDQLARILGALTGGQGAQGAVAGGDGASAEGDSGGGLLGGALGSGVLGALVGQLAQGGLMDQVKSWVGDGANASISPADTRSALGDEAISRAAAEMGVSEDDAAKHLSELLPEAINSMTPDGRLPDGAGDDSWIGLGGLNG